MIRASDSREKLGQAVVVNQDRSTQLPTTRLVSFVKREKYISLLDIRGDAATRTGEAVSHMRYWDHAEKRHGQRQCIFFS